MAHISPSVSVPFSPLSPSIRDPDKGQGSKVPGAGGSGVTTACLGCLSPPWLFICPSSCPAGLQAHLVKLTMVGKEFRRACVSMTFVAEESRLGRGTGTIKITTVTANSYKLCFPLQRRVEALWHLLTQMTIIVQNTDCLPPRALPPGCVTLSNVHNISVPLVCNM